MLRLVHADHEQPICKVCVHVRRQGENVAIPVEFKMQHHSGEL